MGIRVRVPGFSTGIVDEKHLDRVDLDAIQTSVRSAENLIIERSGALTVRPGFASRSDWVTLGTHDDAHIIPFNFTDTGVLAGDDDYNRVLLMKEASTYTLSELDISGDVALQTSNLSALTWSGSQRNPYLSGEQKYSWAQVGDTMVVARTGGFVPMTYKENGTWANFQPYAEKSGYIERAYMVEMQNIKSTDTFSVGEIITFKGAGAGGAGEIKEIHDRDTGAYHIVLGSVTAVPVANDTYRGENTTVLGASSGAPQRVVSVTEVVHGTGSFFKDDYSATDTIRILLADTTVASIISDTIMTLSSYSLFGSAHPQGLHHARKVTLDEFRPQSVASFQGRLVFTGDSYAGSHADIKASPEPGRRVVMSALYDPQVLWPAAQLQDDASSPIDIVLRADGDVPITWVHGGDTIFISTSSAQYALANPERPVGASADLLPVFRKVSTVPTTMRTPSYVTDGRIFFASKDGGLFHAKYDFEQAKYKVMPAAPLTTLGNVVSIASEDPKGGFDGSLIIVANSDGEMFFGVIDESTGIPSGWTKVTLPENMTYKDMCTSGGKFYALVYNSYYGRYVIANLYWPESRYAIDFPVAVTVSGGVHGALNDAYVNKECVYVNGTAAAGFGTDVGFAATISGAGAFPGIEDGTQLIGFPVTARWESGNIESFDRQGSRMGKLRRIVAATVSYTGMKQFYINSRAMLPDEMNIGNTAYLEKTGAATRHIMGYTTDPFISVESQPPYRGTFRSVLMEIA